MSYLNYIYKKPPINLVDGVVKDETVINLGFQIETAFENIGDIFGNLYGDGLETAKYARYFNSLSSGLGDMGLLSPEEPFTIEFDSYSQGFVNNNDRKDFILDLKPIEGQEQTTISIFTNDGITYGWVPTMEEMLNVGDYTTSGRVITFYSVPVGNFSVVYKGTYPEFGMQNGYLPNIYPSPSLIEAGIVPRPTIELMPSGRYRVSIVKTNQNRYSQIFGAELDLTFNPTIDQYVSPVGELEVPKEYVNAWKKFPHSYERMFTRSIYILNDYQFEIDTDEEIDINSDTIVFSIANISISDMVNSLYMTLKDHNHDNSSMIATIDHDKLTNLIPISENLDITYSKSKITNNDHSEYLHREGYRLDDPGTYNNALLGNLLISSTNPDSGFGNVLADSYLLSFGSISDGISLRLSIDGIEPPALAIKTPDDGLHIDSGTINDIGKIHRALRLNRHELFTYGIDNGSSIDQYLALSSDSGRILILDKDDPNSFADMQLNKLFAHDIDVTGLLNILLPDGQLQIGDVILTPNPMPPGGLDIDGDIHFFGLIELDTVDIDTSEIRDLTITEVIEIKDAGTRIEFSDNGKVSEITTTSDAQIEVTSEDPVRYKTPIILDGVSGRDPTTGRINGISFIDDQEPSVQEYSSLYTASQGGGAATPSTASTYLEMHYPESSNLEDNANGLWLLRSTRIPQIEKSVKYSWKSDEGQRVDDLTKWPRAKLAAGFGDFYSIRVNASNLVDKDGVKFGDFNHIFVTGDGGNCPAGLMVLESLAGVAMVSAGMDPADCANVTYSSLIVGDIQSRGSISAEDDISAGGGINAGTELSGDTLEIRKDSQIFGDERVFGNETVDGKFYVLGETSLNADTYINGNLKVTNETDTGNLKVIGVSEFGEIARFQSAVAMEESMSIAGLAQFDGNADFRSRITGKSAYFDDTYVSTLTASDLVSANGGLLVSSNANIRGNLIGESTLDIKGSAVIGSALYAHGLNSTADLNVSAKTTLDGELSTRSNVLFSGEVGVELVSNITSQFTKRALFNIGIDAGSNSTFSSIDVAGAVRSAEVVTGNATIENNANITGVVTASSAKVNNDLTIGGSVTIGQQANNPVLVSINGSIAASESIFSSTEIASGGRISAVGGFDAGTSSNSYIHNLNMTGELSVSGDMYGKGKSTFYGETRIASNLIIDGILELGQSVKIEIGDGRVAIGDVKNISSSGQADDPGQLSVSYGTFKLVDGVTNGNLLPIPAGDNNTDFQAIRAQALQVDNYLRHENMHVNGTAVFAGQVIMNNDIWTNSIRPINVESSGQDWVDIVAKEAYYAAD